MDRKPYMCEYGAWLVGEIVRVGRGKRPQEEVGADFLVCLQQRHPEFYDRQKVWSKISEDDEEKMFDSRQFIGRIERGAYRKIIRQPEVLDALAEALHLSLPKRIEMFRAMNLDPFVFLGAFERQVAFVLQEEFEPIILEVTTTLERSWGNCPDQVPNKEVVLEILWKVLCKRFGGK